MGKRIKVGDVFEIPLSDGRFAYCHYLVLNNQMGYLVRVFDRITDRRLEPAQLNDAGELFPPVFVGLRGAVSSSRWSKVGSLPVPEFEFPTFRTTSRMTAGTHENWWLWKGGDHWSIGKLPPEMYSLELELVWGYEILEERIATGRNPFDRVV